MRTDSLQKITLRNFCGDGDEGFNRTRNHESFPCTRRAVVFYNSPPCTLAVVHAEYLSVAPAQAIG